jgi:hypothetical protein
MSQLTNGTCIVRGCLQPPVLCYNHKMYGLVSACADHNGIRHGYAKDLQMAERPTVQAQPQPRKPQPSGGSKVRNPQPPVKPTPPATLTRPSLVADPF